MLIVPHFQLWCCSSELLAPPVDNTPKSWCCSVHLSLPTQNRQVEVNEALVLRILLGLPASSSTGKSFLLGFKYPRVGLSTLTQTWNKFKSFRGRNFWDFKFPQLQSQIYPQKCLNCNQISCYLGIYRLIFIKKTIMP